MSVRGIKITEKYNELVTESNSNTVKCIYEIYIIYCNNSRKEASATKLKENTERYLVNTYITKL